MLGFDLSRPPDAEDGATVAILLHGRGSHRGDLQALRPHIPESWALITPQAPHPGHPWGYGPGWAWYRYVADDRVDEGSFVWSLEALDRFMVRLPGLLGFQPGRIVLGGFSQGGTTSMAFAYTRPGKVTAALNFSGFLPASTALPTTVLGPDATPVFWGHGKRDPNIPHSLADKGRRILDRYGAPLTIRDYDIGHWIDPGEVADAVAFVEALEE